MHSSNIRPYAIFLPSSSRYRNLDIQKSGYYWTERLDIRTSNIRMSAPARYFLRERRKKLRGGPVHTPPAFSRLSLHMIVQDVAWASAPTSRARWYATSSGRPHATIVSARWVPYGAFRLRALHLFKAAARSCEKDNAAHLPTTAVSSRKFAPGLSHAYVPHPAVHARIVFSAELIAKFLGQEYCLSFSDHY